MGKRKRTDSAALTVRWSLLAIDDLAEIRAHVAQDKPEAAARLARRIIEAADRIVVLPNSGRVGRAKGTRELFVAGSPYFLVYRVNELVVEILRVWHGKRLPGTDAGLEGEE